MEVIADPEDYIKVLSIEGSVIKVGTLDCQVMDWIEYVTLTLKPPSGWHFTG